MILALLYCLLQPSKRHAAATSAIEGGEDKEEKEKAAAKKKIETVTPILSFEAEKDKERPGKRMGVEDGAHTPFIQAILTKLVQHRSNYEIKLEQDDAGTDNISRRDRHPQ